VVYPTVALLVSETKLRAPSPPTLL